MIPRVLGKVMVQCPHCARDMDLAHVAVCASRPVTCSVCKATMPARALVAHRGKTNQCPLAAGKAQCEHCQGWVITAWLGAHIPKCAKLPVSCKRCGVGPMALGLLAAHISEECTETFRGALYSSATVPLELPTDAGGIVFSLGGPNLMPEMGRRGTWERSSPSTSPPPELGYSFAGM